MHNMKEKSSNPNGVPNPQAAKPFVNEPFFSHPRNNNIPDKKNRFASPFFLDYVVVPNPQKKNILDLFRRILDDDIFCQSSNEEEEFLYRCRSSVVLF